MSVQMCDTIANFSHICTRNSFNNICTPSARAHSKTMYASLSGPPPPPDRCCPDVMGNCARPSEFAATLRTNAQDTFYIFCERRGPARLMEIARVMCMPDCRCASSSANAHLRMASMYVCSYEIHVGIGSHSHFDAVSTLAYAYN